MKFLVLLASLMGLASATNSTTSSSSSATATTGSSSSSATAQTTGSSSSSATQQTQTSSSSATQQTQTSSSSATQQTQTSSSSATQQTQTSSSATTNTTTTTTAAGTEYASTVSMTVDQTGYATTALWCAGNENTAYQNAIAATYNNVAGISGATTLGDGCTRRLSESQSRRQLSTAYSYETKFTLPAQTGTPTAITTLNTGILASATAFTTALNNTIQNSGTTYNVVKTATFSVSSVSAPAATAGGSTSSATATGVATALFSVLGLTALFA